MTCLYSRNWIEFFTIYFVILWMFYTLMYQSKFYQWMDIIVGYFLLSILSLPCFCLLHSFRLRYPRKASDEGSILGVLLVPLVLFSKLLVSSTNYEYISLQILTSIWISLTTLLLYKLALQRRIVECSWFGLILSLFLLYEKFPVKWTFVSLGVCIYHLVFSYGTLYIKRCFTFGEAMILAQGIALCVLDSFFLTLIKLEKIKVLHNVVRVFHFSRSPESVALQGGLVSVVVIGIVLGPLLYRYGASHPKKILPHLPLHISCSFYTLFLLCLFIFVIPWLYFLLDETNPITWLTQFLLHDPEKRLGLIFYWSFSIVSLLSLFAVIEKKVSMKGIVIRKLYHGLAVLLFTPAMFIDRDMLSLSFGVALAVLLVCEYFRALSVPPMGRFIAQYMSTYLDSRDSGVMILTHLYLLLGCALPLWLREKSSLKLDNLAGITTLGIGDSMVGIVFNSIIESVVGAIVGSHIGKWYWKGSKRTVEGSFAMFVSMGCFSMAMYYLQYGNLVLTFSKISSSYFISILLTTFLEASTEQIDNLVLPLFHMITCHLASLY